MGINELLGVEHKANIRSKVEDFWFFVEELSTPQRLGEALRARRKATRRRIPTFITVFWISLLAVLIDSSVGNFKANPVKIGEDFNTTIKLDFLYHIAAGIDVECYPSDKDCQAWLAIAETNERTRLSDLEKSYIALVNDLVNSNTTLLKILLDCYVALTLIAMGIPLTIALFISFHFTLWILTRVTSSKTKLLIMLIIDAITVTIMPPVLSNIMLYTFALGFISLGGVFDFAIFNKASLHGLLFGDTSVMLIVSFIIPFVLSNISNESSSTVYWITTEFASSTYSRMSELFHDLIKFIHLDFGVGHIDSAINWAIVTDISYSLYFVIPSVLLVFAQRWGFGREIFLNFISLTESHPKGPVYAIGELLMRLFTALVDTFRKK